MGEFINKAPRLHTYTEHYLQVLANQAFAWKTVKQVLYKIQHRAVIF